MITDILIMLFISGVIAKYIDNHYSKRTRSSVKSNQRDDDHWLGI